MKTIFLAGLILGFWVSTLLPCYAASYTTTLKLVATIPAMIGINYFPEGMNAAQPNPNLAKENFIVISQRIVRDSEPILVESSVLR
ncbi:MAG: hypothetical protein HQL23_00865 [Candidatus Omnitrophica bacterium]|nr:hypothetical protein [Candidatus Omnitrophota bacterium]